MNSLQIFLTVTVSIICVLGFLLISPVHIRIKYNQKKFKISFRYILVFFTIFPKKIQLKNKPKEPVKKKGTPSKKKTKIPIDLSSITEIKESISNIISSLEPIFNSFPSVFKMKAEEIQISIGGDDPAKIALETAALKNGLSFFLEFLDSHVMTLKKTRSNINVSPNFLSPFSSCLMNIDIYARTSSLLFIGLKLLKIYLQELKNQRH